jgi:hypothetical protein
LRLAAEEEAAQRFAAMHADNDCVAGQALRGVQDFPVWHRQIPGSGEAGVHG